MIINRVANHNLQKMLTKKILITLLIPAMILACDKSKKSGEETKTDQVVLAKTPTFNADSAYFFTEKQVKFGPRIPNTPAHIKCGDYLVAMLKKYGCEVTEQKFVTPNYAGKQLNARNIIGSINPAATKRILLASHWDSRPFSDDDSLAKTKPFDSANDGPSGVAVLIEIARVLQETKQKPNIGVDIIFFDVEDWGPSDDFVAKDQKAFSEQFPYGGWLLGSDYWSKNPHKQGYSAYFGILLDMVGAKGATFTKDSFSMQASPSVVSKVWNIAGQLGFSPYFLQQEFGSLTDDHVPVNEKAHINMIDICDLKPNSPSTFPAYHHTQKDNMKIIDKNTLRAVGQTLLQVLYQEGAEVQ